MPSEQPHRILLAEDDEDDYILIRDVLEEIRSDHTLHWVQDGEELMDYLLHRGAHAENGEAEMPDLILLDLNMPKKDGRTALHEIKEHARLRRIPVVVLTTSDADRDIATTYDLGANSYIIKPNSFDDFRALMTSVTKYWFGIVQLPGDDRLERASDASP